MAYDPSQFTGTPGNYATQSQLDAAQNLANTLMFPKQQQTLYAPWQGALNVANALIGGYFGHLGDVKQLANANQTGQGPNIGAYQPSYPANLSMASAVSGASGSGAQPLGADAADTVAFLKQQEGFSPRAYSDYAQTSIGYGTKARPGESNITQEEAENRLRQEAGNVNDFINQNVKVPINPYQRTALTSFGYNVGTGRGGLSDLLPYINSNDWSYAADRMQHYNRAGGQVLSNLITRRALEGRLLTQPYNQASQ